MVLTTRQEVPELEGHGSLVVNHALEDLSDRAGADLLVELGVHGRQRDLEAAVRELQGHALSVTLLGTYLAEVRGGDIRHRDQFDGAHHGVGIEFVRVLGIGFGRGSAVCASGSWPRAAAGCTWAFRKGAPARSCAT